jgi:hypothetical protein
LLRSLQWSDWTPCAVSCVTSGTSEALYPTQHKHRKILYQPKIGGSSCGTVVAHRKCTSSTPISAGTQRGLPVCPVDCEVSEWDSCSACDRTCGGGGGSVLCSRSVVQPAAHGGRPCPALVNASVGCAPAHCPTDCRLGGWGQWGPCSVTCGVSAYFESFTCYCPSA